MSLTTDYKYRRLMGTNIFTGEGNIRTGSETFIRKKDGTTEQARPIGYRSGLFRFKCAMHVLLGYADIVVWKE